MYTVRWAGRHLQMHFGQCNDTAGAALYLLIMI